jgi:hypothetical protein
MPQKRRCRLVIWDNDCQPTLEPGLMTTPLPRVLGSQTKTSNQYIQTPLCIYAAVVVWTDTSFGHDS